MAGITKTTDIDVTERSVDFVTSFSKTWTALTQIMGITRPIKKTAGTQLKAYTATLVLEDGEVAEGETIPLSKATIEEAFKSDLTIRKYAKAVTIEDVDKYGVDIAIEKTDEAFKDEIINETLGQFYDFALDGTLTDTAATFQAAVAKAVGSVKNKFQQLRKNGSRVVVWLNTMDAYNYLGAAELSVQSQFGIDYIKNFMGAETVILSSDIPTGKVVATPVDNIINYYADPSQEGFKKLGLVFTTDADLPMLGFAVVGKYSNATGETYAIIGNVLWAEYVDAIAVITVEAAETAGE